LATLRFKIKDIVFEYIGEHKDMIQFIQELMASPFDITVTPIQPQEAHKISTKEMSLPSNEDVLAYIVSRPNYQHTLYDVQKHFFGRAFITTDKETLGMYFKTMKQVKEVRNEIEKRYHGKFEKKRGKGRLDYYTFKQEEKLT